MARIAAAVMGDSLGHLNQISAVAREMKGHEFLFLGGGTVVGMRRLGYLVEELPMPATLYANNKVDTAATAVNAVKVFLGFPGTARKVARIIKEFDPVLILTSYEFFVPIVARAMGKYCVSVDRQHFLTKCQCDSPNDETLSRVMFSLPLRLMYSYARKYLINTFFPLTPIDQSTTEVYPPLVTPAVMETAPSEGEYVLVYQTSPTFERLLDVLEQMPNRFIVYGFGERPPRRNVEFRPRSPERFVQDLAGCRYAITNGGHTVISEALYFGKPVFAFPIHLAYEQFFNAYMLKKLGYGDYALDPAPSKAVLTGFEQRLDQCRSRISQGDFCGNSKVVSRLEEIVRCQEAGVPAEQTHSED